MDYKTLDMKHRVGQIQKRATQKVKGMEKFFYQSRNLGFVGSQNERDTEDLIAKITSGKF